MLRLGIAPLLALLASAAPPQTPEPKAAPAGTDPSLQQFGNLSKTFHVDVPKGWRQISPKEALLLSEKPTTPVDLRRAEPRSQYAVGPVDQWLTGDLGGAWLLVTEIGEEAVIPEDYAAQLREMWRQHSEANGIGQEVSDIQREKVGPQHHQTCARRAASMSTPLPVASRSRCPSRPGPKSSTAGSRVFAPGCRPPRLRGRPRRGRNSPIGSGRHSSRAEW